jgi:hypothetical protein
MRCYFDHASPWLLVSQSMTRTNLLFSWFDLSALEFLKSGKDDAGLFRDTTSWAFFVLSHRPTQPHGCLYQSRVYFVFIAGKIGMDLFCFEIYIARGTALVFCSLTFDTKWAPKMLSLHHQTTCNDLLCSNRTWCSSPPTNAKSPRCLLQRTCFMRIPCAVEWNAQRAHRGRKCDVYQSERITDCCMSTPPKVTCQTIRKGMRSFCTCTYHL